MSSCEICFKKVRSKQDFSEASFQRRSYRRCFENTQEICHIHAEVWFQQSSTLLKSYFGMGVLLSICSIFSEQKLVCLYESCRSEICCRSWEKFLKKLSAGFCLCLSWCYFTYKAWERYSYWGIVRSLSNIYDGAFLRTCYASKITFDITI